MAEVPPGDRQSGGKGDLPEGYRDIPEADRKRAEAFFARGKTVADTGNYDYAIEMYLQGLGIDPENVEAHRALRDISLRRKVSGGKDLGMFEKMKLKRATKDDKQNMLTAEKLLAYDPGNTDVMLQLMQSAQKAGFYDTVMWMGDVLGQAMVDRPDFKKYIALRDTYVALQRWKKAVEVCQRAYEMQPADMDLHRVLKDLGARETMAAGNYESAGSFRDSIRNMDQQKRLLDSERDVQSLDLLQRNVQDAEADWKADPNDPSRVTKLVDALERTEQAEHENRAIELLEDAYRRTRQFSFRQRIGKINMAQMRRMERAKRDAVRQRPDDEELRKDYAQFRREQVEFELAEYRAWAEAYPTQMPYKYEMGLRMFQLKQFDQAIPVLQQARSDPKYRIDAGVLLGRSFLEAGFIDEAIETLQGIIDEYQLRGDDKSKQMYYHQGRALEAKGDKDAALKRYSQVAQWDFGYLDVQKRIKDLRTAG